MFSKLFTLGAKYVPSVLRTVGSGLGKIIGGSSIVRTVGSKITQSPILSHGLNFLK